MTDLTFFCELDSNAFEALFAEPAVTAHLLALGAGVSVGLRDLSPERAAVLRRLNDAGIPLTAWLLLPEEQGYWLNINNASEAAARYDAFCEWTATHGLRWEAVGLDIEFDMREVRALIADRRRIAPTLLRNLLNGRRLRTATTAYDDLVRRIRADGYLVESYVIPFVLDERRAGATLLQRLTGLVDTPADREIPMLYSSFMRPYGAGVLASYAREARAAGIGSTGGGVSVGGADQIAPLSWDELARDLRIARRSSKTISIFSLEGCVHAGYLERLRAFDWDAPVDEPVREIKLVERARALARAILWMSANPLLTLALLMGSALLLRVALRRAR